MTRRVRIDDDKGAVLVLALVLMIVIALVLLGVVTLAGNDLTNTSHLLTEQSLEYRSSGAMDVAIETVRYSDTTFGGGSCLSSSRGVTVGSAGSNSPPVYVDCVSVPKSELPSDTGVSREVNFYACGTSPTSCTSNNYTVWATVDFVDGPTCSSSSPADCGAGANGVPGENIKSWLVHGAAS